ncbi:MAG: 2-C-methyl-D-erythritol 4-phosphate cytidylyltransferase [Deltaproteobacteria bacterium]|nr:2-C-methyl-D-erythritol 4-phosphate cytidylyltransferase [Deltaproteobacteria bacterium]
MNIALIFAGGTGIRMSSKSLPKQFLKYAGKPILIYTLERFEMHPFIDSIAVICLSGWEKELEKHINCWQIEKVKWLVTGGETSQKSIYNGLQVLKKSGVTDDSIILIHDGVRPLVDEETISNNIETVRIYGNCITVAREHETFIHVDPNNCVHSVGNRGVMRVAKAPQSFYFRDILRYHQKARDEGKSFIDSASLMFDYGVKLRTIECGSNNIKVTLPSDFYIFKALYEAEENSKIVDFSMLKSVNK